MQKILLKVRYFERELSKNIKGQEKGRKKLQKSEYLENEKTF